MTQQSIIQPGHSNALPTSDTGPYSADQWAAMYRTILTLNQDTEQGVLARYLNEQAVTEAPANQLNVDTGGGIVAGHWFSSDAAMAFVPGAPAANPRIDVIVMCQNNTAVAATVGIATANNLIFPTDLTDYDGSASIEPFTTRLVVLQGTEGAAPVAPTLDVDTATLFMVPLAQYEISVAGAVTALAERRKPALTPTGSWTLLDEQVGTGISTIDFANISQLYTSLKIIGTGSAGTGPIVEMRFNGDATAVYDWVWIEADGAGSAVNDAVNDNGLRVASVSPTANYVDIFEITIAEYRSLTHHKAVLAQFSEALGSGANNFRIYNMAGIWHNAAIAAITDINLQAIGHVDDIGYRASLYGLA